MKRLASVKARLSLALGYLVDSTFPGRMLDILGGLPNLRLLRMRQSVEPASIPGVSNLTQLKASERVQFSAQAQEFLAVCKYFNDGGFQRPAITVCDLPNAYIHVGTGSVFTEDFRFVADPAMGYRLSSLRRGITPANRLRLKQAQKFSEPLAVVYEMFSYNYWHWIYDSLARVYSLALAREDEPFTIVMPNSLPTQKRDFLGCLLPEKATVEYLDSNVWIQADRLIMPSFVSSRANGHMPTVYSQYMRESVFAHYGLSRQPEPKRRFYISRSRAKHRRVLNEQAVLEVLQPLNFDLIHLEDLSFEEEVTLFKSAETIVTPHGAGLASTLFSGKIKVLILYPNCKPTTFFFTQLEGLGQEHHFILHDQPGEDDDFTVDLNQLRSKLKEMIEA